MYHRASDRVENEPWLAELDRAADDLDVGPDARSTAVDLFLSHLPDEERSKPAVAAAALYTGALVAGEERSQAAVADAMGVARLSIQSRWKELLADAGFEPPTW
ncbi:Cyclin domain containing protein, TFIIB-like protein [Halalkaliarchaeum sp. AArc-CO]|uniref:transcription initiation factor IIB family protein n=1 Tax=Halalkaliarchaeum sp. AArc-CO TaxID=2866381 RepID=UPI00217E5896|nr:transcription initiation factor IIB family protein [Halalkaliarchaeum sp. AArc-CO]UWG50895.1 Cyclin domain containing protein, TFIIB-like protein [Halalkaliarchaeum sp. AArc-CO]